MSAASNPGKIDEPTIQRYASGLLGLFAEAQKMTTPVLIAKLEGYFKTLPHDDVGPCSVCGRESSMSKCTECPFCGTSDDTDDPGEKQKTSDEPAANMATATKNEETKEEGKNMAQTNGVTQTSTGEMKRKKKAKEGASTEIVKTEAADLAKPPPPPGSLISGGLTINDLDAAVQRIHTYQRGTASQMHKLGLELRSICDRDMWRLRTTEQGRAVHKTFEAFCRDEVNLGAASVNRLMEIANQYTPQQIEEFGMTNLRSLLSAPKEARGAIMDKLSSGELKTTRQVEAEVSKARQKAGTQVSERGDVRGGASRTKKATAKAAAKKAETKKDREKVVTIALPSASEQIKLYKQGNKDKRATRLADKPEGVLQCSNGTLVRAQVRESSAGELYILLTAKRN